MKKMRSGKGGTQRKQIYFAGALGIKITYSLFQYSATSWEMAFQEYMSANANRLSGLKITWFSSLTHEVEFEKFIVPTVVSYFG